MRKKTRKIVSHKKRSISNTKLMFLSVILLLIVIEALYILKDSQATDNKKEVAGVSSSK